MSRRNRTATKPTEPDGQDDSELDAEESGARSQESPPEKPKPSSLAAKLLPCVYAGVAIAIITPEDGADLACEPFGDFISRYKLWLAENPEVEAIAKVK